MRTLHPALRVTDIARSLQFYSAIGYAVIGSVPGTPLGRLTLLKLADDEFCALELVEGPDHAAVPLAGGLSHLAIQVDSLTEIRDALAAAGFSTADIQRPGGDNGPETSWVSDPDGYRIELTQWPPGHPMGITEADFR